VTVENKAGAGGRLATDAAAKSNGDGYTIILLVGADAVIAATDPRLPYSLLRDFEFVTTITEYPFILVTAAESKLTGVSQMIELAVVSQDVVPIEPETGSWGPVSNGRVWPMEVVVVHPGL
jgi:tripartite-type tricarboxylate transporter receptor subunit TctC